jgi:Arc/MetJ-type ribon-helix-helix transcriptional regulator
MVLDNIAHMSASVTSSQKRLVKHLLKIGRWNNESEIIRYGLHLVAKEVERDQERNLDPYPPGVLAKAYRKLGKAAFEEDRAMANASAYPGKGELE